MTAPGEAPPPTPAWAGPPSGWAAGEPGDGAARRARSSLRAVLAELRGAAAVAAVVVLLGAPVGLVWGWVAPRAPLVKVADGVDLRAPETKAFVAGDAEFLLVTALVGLLCGVVVALVVRRGRTGALLGATVGGLLAAAVAAAVGHRVGYPAFVALRDRAPVGTRGDAYLALRSTSAVVGWPAAAAAGLAAVELIRQRREVHRSRRAVTAAPAPAGAPPGAAAASPGAAAASPGTAAAPPGTAAAPPGTAAASPGTAEPSAV